MTTFANALIEQPIYIQAIFAAGILLITMSMLIGLRNRRKRAGTGPNLTAHEHIERLKQKQGIRDDLESLAIEIESMARRVGAQLDNQATRLDTLLRLAEQRIARLESLQDTLLHGRPNPGHDVAQPPPVATTTAAVTTTTHSPTPTPDRLMHDVYQLADQGQPAPDIARSLDQPIGKIELILALRKS